VEWYPTNAFEKGMTVVIVPITATPANSKMAKLSLFMFCRNVKEYFTISTTKFTKKIPRYDLPVADPHIRRRTRII
jgi:hypothetical protein